MVIRASEMQWKCRALLVMRRRVLVWSCYQCSVEQVFVIVVQCEIAILTFTEGFSFLETSEHGEAVKGKT